MPHAKQKGPALRSTSTLLAILYALQGKKLIFELRNDTVITGRLTDVDENMNALAA